jgi:hypothetical protein
MVRACTATMDPRHTIITRLRLILDRAARGFRGRRRGVYEFGTSQRRLGAVQRLTESRRAELIQALALVERVESSPLIRTVEPLATGDAPQHASVGRLQIRAAGVSGVISIPCGPECELRTDIDGMPIDVTSSDGARFEAVCSGRSGDNAGVTIRFILAPAPGPAATWLRVSLAPFPVDRRGDRTITLKTSLK